MRERGVVLWGGWRGCLGRVAGVEGWQAAGSAQRARWGTSSWSVVDCSHVLLPGYLRAAAGGHHS